MCVCFLYRDVAVRVVDGGPAKCTHIEESLRNVGNSVRIERRGGTEESLDAGAA